jgi:hypothetical protein
MRKLTHPLSYLAVFALTGIVAGFAFHVFDWGRSIIGCRQYKDPSTFLSYCAAQRFSYYEHGAFYLGLEPRAIESLQRAEVLVLGDSRALFAFSTDVAAQFFAVRSVRFYLMAFTFGEGAEFARAIIEKYKLKPKLLVIVTDPFFFKGALSPPASEILESEGSWWKKSKIRIAYEEKKWFRDGQSLVCSYVPTICTQDVMSFYRSYSNGTLIWRDISYPPNGAVPFSEPTQGQVVGTDVADRNRGFAIGFLKEAGVRPSCAVITTVPNNQINSVAFTHRLGELLRTPVVIPRVGDLVGVDPSHLDWPSAQRWSAAFLELLDPILSQCR